MNTPDYKAFVCEGCSIGFSAERKRRYCTTKCNRAHIKRAKNSVSRSEYLTRVREHAAGNFTCAHCGIAAHRRLSGRNKSRGYVNTYCSIACRDLAVEAARALRPPPPAKPKYQCTCEICQAVVESSWQRVICSVACMRERERQRARASNMSKVGVKSARACRFCGNQFAPEYGDKRSVFCSDKCQVRLERRARGKNHRTRARKAGVAYEPVNRMKVFDRDGWKCQICGRPTPQSRMGTTKSNAPELDHRIPISKGGGHLYSNVQCACRRCNCAKGNRSEAGQLPLFG